jgi:hypothetical protein
MNPLSLKRGIKVKKVSDDDDNRDDDIDDDVDTGECALLVLFYYLFPFSCFSFGLILHVCSQLFCLFLFF